MTAAGPAIRAKCYPVGDTGRALCAALGTLGGRWVVEMATGTSPEAMTSVAVMGEDAADDVGTTLLTLAATARRLNGQGGMAS
jgi:predicted aconitase